MEIYKDAVVRRLIALAHRHARRRAGLGDTDAADFAITFAERLLLHARPGQAPCLDASLLRWHLNRHTTDFWRARKNDEEHECPWPETASGDDPPFLRDLPDSDACDPEAACLRKEAWEQVLKAAEQLQQTPRQLYLRHVFQEQSVAQLAAATGKSENAVRHALERAQNHVCAALTRRGVTEQDFRAHPFAPPPATAWLRSTMMMSGRRRKYFQNNPANFAGSFRS